VNVLDLTIEIENTK